MTSLRYLESCFLEGSLFSCNVKSLLSVFSIDAALLEYYFRPAIELHWTLLFGNFRVLLAAGFYTFGQRSQLMLAINK